jgi:hypothetical protein
VQAAAESKAKEIAALREQSFTGLRALVQSSLQDLQHHILETQASPKGLSMNDRKGIKEILIMASRQLPADENAGGAGLWLPENASELTEVWLKLKAQKRQ